MTHKIKVLLTVFVAVFVAACSSKPPQKPLALEDPSKLASNGKIVVLSNQIPQPNTFFPGASCLLCIGAAEIANSSLTNHVQKLPIEDLASLKQEVANILKQQGKAASPYALPVNFDEMPDFDSELPNTSKYDFSKLGAKLSAQQFLVINIPFVGAQRPYSSYVPSGDPKAVITGEAYIVNAATNVYEWYQPLHVVVGAEGEWDQPDNQFPNMTNAYYRAIENVRDAVIKPMTFENTASAE